MSNLCAENINENEELVGPQTKKNTLKASTRKQKQQIRRKQTVVDITVGSDSSTCSSNGLSSSSEPSSLPSSSVPPRKHWKPSNRKNKKSNSPLKYPVTKKIAYEQNDRYVALDCEMVGVGLDGQQSELARVTIIDWNGNILLDEYIKPRSEVTDYRTFVSGITKEQLTQNARMNLLQCRRIVLEIVKNKIVIGHALENDLRALGILHPWYQIRDTAKYEPFMKLRFDDGVLWPRKLKDLSEERLRRKIQISSKPHSPYEDALAALDLYKSVQRSWEKFIKYQQKMANEMERQRQNRLRLMRTNVRTSYPHYVSGNTRHGSGLHNQLVHPPYVNIIY